MLAFLFEPGFFVTAYDSGVLAEEPKQHPLAWTLAYASSSSEYIRDNIQDYSCRLIKRERIDGKLQPMHFADVKVRCEQRVDGEVVKPTAVFIRFLAPSKVKDRRILWIEGENNGDMLVRKGGSIAKYTKLKIDPNSAAAKRESKYPVTEIGFDKILARLVHAAQAVIQSDPNADNITVAHYQNAKVDKRNCTHLRVVYPEQKEGVMFHEADLYVDTELRVPIRLVVYGFPEGEDGEKPVLEEYTYTNLKLNIGLTDDDFSPELLGSGSPGAAKAAAAKTASGKR